MNKQQANEKLNAFFGQGFNQYDKADWMFTHTIVNFRSVKNDGSAEMTKKAFDYLRFAESMAETEKKKIYADYVEVMKASI